MANEAYVSVIGFVATQPRAGYSKSGSRSMSMRVGWTPRTFDRATGAWSDLPSSFITVQCYKKVAEHAAVCLRRGDPVVVRGTMRVREYVDQNGQRRSSVEVTADSIGHDLSRGITVFSRPPARAEQTAYEYEQALAAAAGRTPLPGDLSAAESDGAQDAGGEPDGDAEEGSELIDDPELGSAGTMEPEATEPELAVGEEFDESAARGALAGADDTLEPVGAPA
jgi:single-strand DNA-binding protein